ncbi:retrovirus-related pol polyprotein from transposon TNT 1-94 [Tanacetum coccineum]
MSQEIVHIAMNYVDILDVKKSCVNGCNKCLELETELLKKKDLIEKDVYNKLLKSYSTLKKHCISLELTTQLNQEVFQKDNFRENQNAPTFNQLFKLNDLKAQSQEKDTVIRKLKDMIKSLSEKDNVENKKKDIDEIETINIELEHTLKKELRKLKGKNVFDTAVSKPNATIAPGMFKLDIEPIFIDLRTIGMPMSEKLVAVTPMNKDKKFRFSEPVTSSSNIPKQTDSLKTKDSNKTLLTSTGVTPTTSASRSKPSGNTQNNRITRPSSRNQKNKVEEHPRKVKSRLNKRDFVSEPISNVHVKHSVRNAKFESICALCNKCLFDANHDMCVIDYVNDVNVRSKSQSKRNKKRKVWKPTGKVFTKIRYSWKPTRRIFTIVGNRCPITRIASTKEVPLRETTITLVITPSLELKVYNGKPKASRSVRSSSKAKIVESKSTNSKKPKQSWDPLFGSDHIAKIMSYGDYQIGNVIISRVYYVDSVYLLKGSRGSNLHTLFMDNLLLSSPICLLSKASKTKSWLWHRRLSHLNFDYITSLAKQSLVRGLSKLKYQKDHLCSACALGKSKKLSHKPKAEDSIQEKLYLLHMDLCGPMRIQSINGRKYILVIVDDYSRFTWVKFLRSKDEVPELVIKFLKMIQVRLNATIRNIKADNGTEFVNQTLKAYYEENRTLMEAACTMFIFSKALLFLWAKAVATACYAQNRSLIRKRHNKTPYELIHDRKPDLCYLHVFGALYYPTNDGEDLGKLKPKADIGIFVGYALAKKAFRIYNKRTKMIIKSIHVDFDELTGIAS